MARVAGITDMIHLEQESKAKWSQGHKTFVSNCQLSIAVAAWVTLLGLPSYWYTAQIYTFGEQSTCGEADLFEKVNVSGTLQTYDPKVHGDAETIWCGILQNSYLDNWSNFVQMIVFTVYQNTGTTIMQAWQGLIGTFCAVLNVFLMDLLFDKEEQAGWFGWVDALGIIFLVLISHSQDNTKKFAISWHVFFMMNFVNRHKKNDAGEFPMFPQAKKPAWDQYTVVVLFTALAGVLVAILCTVFPPPGRLNYLRVVDDADMVTKAINDIWTKAIEYFTGSQKSARCFVVAEAITSMNKRVSGVQKNLSDAWWETFDLFGFGKKRALYNVFDATLQKTGAVMVAVQDSLLTEEFGRSHSYFCSGIKDSVMNLKDHALTLLERCEKSCRDGDIDSDEEEEISEAIDLVKESQRNLLMTYRQLAEGEKAKGARFISTELANENEFVFSLSVWARKITDFADNIREVDSNMDAEDLSCGRTMLRTLSNGFLSTWQLPSKDWFIWALRQFIPISFAFWLGYALPCVGQDAEDPKDLEGPFCSVPRVRASVFTPFDANMANTLGLLITHNRGSAFINNVMRLLGVTLGKVTPIVINGALNTLGSRSPGKTVATAISIFVFTWLTNYMYYSSKRWSTVGCLMAGFGCAILIRPKKDEAMANYSSNYKDIAQVVMAIIIQILIDGIFDYLQDDWPRDAAVRKVSALKESIIDAFTAFFNGDVSELKRLTNSVKGMLAEAQALEHEADPDMQLVPCQRTAFKIKLYSDALKQLQMLHGDLNLLVLTASRWHPDLPPKDGNDQTALEDDSDVEESRWYGEFDLLEYMQGLDSVHGRDGVQDELLHSIDTVLSSLEAMLAYGAEDANFQESRKTEELIDMTVSNFQRGVELYEEINNKPWDNKYEEEVLVCEDPRAKVTVAVRALKRAKAHLGEVEKLMMPYIIL